MLTRQPLLQALAGGILAGWLTASVPALHRAAFGFIAGGDLILTGFRKILWYYPIMIGCLAIGIPLKFGAHGLALYGQCVLWDMGNGDRSLVRGDRRLLQGQHQAILAADSRLLRHRLAHTGFGTGGSSNPSRSTLSPLKKTLD